MDLDLIKPPFLAFVKNEKLLNIVEGEVIGSLIIVNQTKASKLVVEGLEEGFVNQIAQFTLTTRDAEGRQCYNEDGWWRS